jgi:hypothetical protein
VAHVEVVHLRGEVGKGGAGSKGHGSACALELLGEDRDLLAKLSRLQGVGADELLFVELQLAVHLHKLMSFVIPGVLLLGERIVLNLQAMEVFLELAELVAPRLLLFLEFLCVFLLALPRVKTVIMLANVQE